MKKSELYHLINSLIQKSKQQKSSKDETHPQFVTNYCQKFLKKNRLIPKSKNQKIKQIMKGFQNLDSYVDLNDIITAIHEHINMEMNKEQKNQMKIKQKLKLIPKTITEPSESVPKYVQAIQKADQVIKRTYKEGYYMQLNKCANIVDQLESTSNQLNNVKYKNSANALTFHQLINKKYSQGRRRFQNQQVQSLEGSQLSSVQLNQANTKSCQLIQKNTPWRMLQEKDRQLGQLNRFEKSRINETSVIENSLLDLKYSKPQPNDRNHSNHFDYSKMLHASAVYLHLILEREHYKKWALQKKGTHIDIVAKQTLKTTTQNTTNGPSQFPQHVRSTCTEQDSECKGILKQQRDQIQHFNWFHKKNKKKSIKFAKIKINDKALKNTKSELSQNSIGLKEDNIDFLNKTLKSCKDTKFILNKPKSVCKQQKIYLKTQPSIHNNFSLSKQNTKQTKKSRASICQQNMENQMFKLDIQQQNSQKKRPRHTLGNVQNLQILCQLGYDSKTKHNQKQYLQNKQKENKQIRQKFTFKKRKVKQGVLRKITQFVNDVQYAQRNMIIQSKSCEKQLQNIQSRLQFQYSGFQEQKILNDEGALQGVRCALSKASTGLKRYHK